MTTEDYLESLQNDLQTLSEALNLEEGTNFTDLATMANEGEITRGGGSSVVVGDLKDNHTEARKFNFDEHEAGIYIDSSLGTNLYMSLTTGSGTYTRFRTDRLLWLNYFDSTITSDPFAIGLTINSDSYELAIQKFSKAQDGRLTVTKANLGYYSSYLVTASPQSFSGTKTFMTTPKLYSYTAPTYDEEIVAKKYVDDKPTTYAGYDATKTQVLKNVNGTLTWVDE